MLTGSVAATQHMLHGYVLAAGGLSFGMNALHLERAAPAFAGWMQPLGIIVCASGHVSSGDE